jgi:hypothetical protein
MQQLTYAKKRTLESRETPEPTLHSPQEASVRPFVAARCDSVPLFHKVTTPMKLGLAIQYFDPLMCARVASQPMNRSSATVPIRSRQRIFRSTGGVLVGVLIGLVLVAAGILYHLNHVPADLDLSTTRLSAHGIYKVGYVSRRDPIPLNQIHSWTIHIETAAGRPVEHAAIAVDGDMPQHLHGLPTRPQVSKELGNGDYLVDGLKFHMSGWWVVDYQIDAAGQHDVVRFNLVLR